MKISKKILLSLFILLALTAYAYSLNLDKIKIYFLKGDYREAIAEGEKLLAKSPHSKVEDELYYILGLSYLKEGNLLRASDIFEIVMKEFKDSKFEEEAILGLGDTYLLKGDLEKAQWYYEELVRNRPHSKLLAQAYSRLSQIGFKKGDRGQGKEYMDKLRHDFPLNPESKMDADLPVFQDGLLEVYYTVQVGSFSNSRNAKNLSQILLNKGYAAYIEEINSSGKTTYKVRVGKLRLRKEAVDLEKRLTQEGYPTKIFP